MDSGLNGYPPMAADWLTVADQFTRYDRKVAVNIAIILGNSPVRIWAAGWDDTPASDSQIDVMKSVVREAMQEGAWGLSTGLDYPPGSFCQHWRAGGAQLGGRRDGRLLPHAHTGEPEGQGAAGTLARGDRDR